MTKIGLFKNMPSHPLLRVLDWGTTRHEDATLRQETLVTERISDLIPDTLVFTEHEPVFTLGLRAGAETHILWDEKKRADQGVAVVKTNRGGDVTYHGPGQLVGYPIVNLKPHPDLHAYLRFLEQVLIDSLLSLGLKAQRRPEHTGLWIENRKIAAIGVAVRRWVTYHGFALNIDPDLSHFLGIVPCGIEATVGTVTSMSKELVKTPTYDEVKKIIASTFTTSLPTHLNHLKAAL
jgi:lipoyl(octanoyl) transferase